MAFEKVLFKNMENAGYTGSLADYEKQGGYKAIRKAFKEYEPAELIELVKRSGLRGRGGAGFPPGMKWSFLPGDSAQMRYLCCNADESEPGTFKDRQLIERDPHQMIEGMILTCYAIGAPTAYIYIRGEFVYGFQVLKRALAEAYRAGYLGKNILKSGMNLNIYLHQGAGAYICGEETALLESIEGKRGLPRNKPPFPAVHGLYGKPTIVNNVETLSNLPHIVNRGPDWFNTMGAPPRSPGLRIFSVSGHVNRPGNYEVPMGITLRALIDEHAGGVQNNKKIKAIIPGGASAAFLTNEFLETKLDFESIAQAGSMLGSGGVTVMNEDTCMVWAALNLMEFFSHETCGKCSPCREGSSWLVQIMRRIEHGHGRPEDLDQLVRICKGIEGKTICAFGDAEIAPIMSTLKHWRSEYESHIKEKRCIARARGGELLSIGCQ